MAMGVCKGMAVATVDGYTPGLVRNVLPALPADEYFFSAGFFFPVLHRRALFYYRRALFIQEFSTLEALLGMERCFHGHRYSANVFQKPFAKPTIKLTYFF